MQKGDTGGEEAAKAALAEKRERMRLEKQAEEGRRDVPPGIEVTGCVGIREKIAVVQQSVGTIAKNGVNPHFGSRYATLDEVWGQIKNLLKDARLVVYCTTEGAGEEWTLTTHVADLDSTEEVFARFPIPSKGNPQQIGSAITYARRYTLCSLLQIVTADEDDDGNAATQGKAAKGKAGEAPW